MRFLVCVLALSACVPSLTPKSLEPKSATMTPAVKNALQAFPREDGSFYVPQGDGVSQEQIAAVALAHCGKAPATLTQDITLLENNDTLMTYVGRC